MKRSAYVVSLIIIAVVVTMIVRCVNDDTSGSKDVTDVPVQLQGLMAGVYAGENGAIDNLLKSVGLYAYNGSGQARYTNENFSSTDSVLSATNATTQYWQLDEQLTIYAYAPYRTISNPEAVPLTVETNQKGGIQNSDFLFASQSGVTSSNWNNPEKILSFTHCLSKINVNIKRAFGNEFVTDSDLTSSSVKISNTVIDGKFNLKASSNQFSLGTSRDDILTCPITTVETGFEKSFHAIIMPQIVQKEDVFLEITLGKKKYTYQLAQPYTFESGKAYTFYLTVDVSEIFLNVSETPWVTGESGIGERIKYKVGDYFPYPDDAGSAVGVVYQITDGTGYSGSVVSLTEGQEVWWRSGSDGFYLATTSQTNGMANYNAALTWVSANSSRNLIRDLPAMGWCYAYGIQQGEDGLWYLPAIEELMALRNSYADNTGTIKSKITLKDGSKDDYISSTKINMSITETYLLKVRIGKISPEADLFRSKDNSPLYYVRAVRSFDNR